MIFRIIRIKDPLSGQFFVCVNDVNRKMIGQAGGNFYFVRRESSF